MFWNSLLKEPLAILILISNTVSKNVNFWIYVSGIHLRCHSLKINLIQIMIIKTTKVFNIWYPWRWRFKPLNTFKS